MLNAYSHNIHIARYYVAQLDSTLYSISPTNKHLQRRIREKPMILFSLTQSAMDTFPAILLNRKILKHTHTHAHIFIHL